MMDIDNRLREHYQGLDVQPDMLSQLTRTSGTLTPLARLASAVTNQPVISWCAAVLILVTVTLGTHQYGASSERTLRTLNEAAMNHSTRLQLEFEADTIDNIDQQMTQLQFTVALPSEFDEQYAVLGARYCTINGELAAHVKFMNKETKKQMSLFMTRSAKGLQNVDDTTKQIDGVNVKLWRETGLFYAVASRSPLI